VQATLDEVSRDESRLQSGSNTEFDEDAMNMHFGRALGDEETARYLTVGHSIAH
jgi:hypothetical protein